MSTENIDRIKVWTTDKGKEPDDSNLAISRKVSNAELNNPIEVDVWADFITDGAPKKKVGSVTFSYRDKPTGEIVPSIVYSPSKVDVGTVVSLDGSGTKASSPPDAIINSWSWKVTNEGGMSYPVTDEDKIQASFTCPDLNWLYVTLAVKDTNGKTASTKVMIDVGEPQPPPGENHPPVAVAGGDKVVKEKTTVTLDGSQSHDPDEGDSIVKYEWTQTYGEPLVGGIINKYQSIASFVAPEVTTSPPPPPPPPPPVEGEIDQYGQIWYHANGEQFLIKQSRDQADDDRWSGNVTGVGLGYESMMIAKSIGISGDGHFASKLYGGNHSGSGASSQRWYDLGLRSDGTIQLQWEGPHPSNHDFTVPERCQFIKKISKGLEGNWIGLKWMVYKVNGQQNGSPSNGGVRVQMWVNEDPISSDGKKVLNENWKKAVDFIDGKDVNVINPQSFVAPDECDIEIRRSNTKNHEVWGGGQHIRRLGTFKATGATEMSPSSFLERSRLELEETKSLGFRLTVTDSKGATNSDDVLVTVTKADIPPPPPPPTETFKIGHIGDTHGRASGINGIKNLITREKVDFLLHSGDTTDDESDASPYVDLVTGLGLKYGINLANSQGNHESSEEGGEDAQKDIEDAFPALKQNKWLQYYHVKNVIIITGNTQLPNYSQINSEASKHIQDSLVKAKAALDAGTADWVFFMQHKPMYVLSNGGHEAEYNFRYVFHKLFDQYGVDFYLDGHVHIEQRTLPLIFGGDGTNVPPKVNAAMKNGAHDFTIKPHGVICCINGSSSKSHGLNEDTNPWTAYAADDGNAYTVFEIKGKNLVGKYIDIESGSVRHEFKVTKEGGLPPPPPPGCDPGYHWDPVLKQCVPDVLPPSTEFTFNVSGDFRDTPESGDNLISDKPTLILSTGDYGIAADPDDWVNNTMKQWKDSGIPTYGALGNHDDAQDYLATGFFKNTSWSWSHRQGNICFIAANTISENVSETDNLIAEAQSDSNINKIIVLMHEGIFHPKVGTSVGSDTTLEFHNSFKKYSKVKMVICGHTHVFGMSKPIDNILYVMNGIGGQSPSSGSTSPGPFHKINGALHCAVNKDGSIKCDCIPNKDDAPNTMWSFTIGPNGELPTTGVEFERRD